MTVLFCWILQVRRSKVWFFFLIYFYFFKTHLFKQNLLIKLEFIFHLKTVHSHTLLYFPILFFGLLRSLPLQLVNGPSVLWDVYIIYLGVLNFLFVFGGRGKAYRAFFWKWASNPLFWIWFGKRFGLVSRIQAITHFEEIKDSLG